MLQWGGFSEGDHKTQQKLRCDVLKARVWLTKWSSKRPRCEHKSDSFSHMFCLGILNTGFLTLLWILLCACLKITGVAAPSKKSHQQNLAARLSGLPALCRALRQKDGGWLRLQLPPGAIIKQEAFGVEEREVCWANFGQISQNVPPDKVFFSKVLEG